MDFKEVEKKWIEYWEKHPELCRADNESDKPKKYILNEFPYPSGSGLHVGHAFSFTGGDVFSRFKRMQGYNVLFPMGWDAFGLPTENYAIKMKKKPQEVTKTNTDVFRSQMKRLALSFDWSREVNTTDPNYYKWTQWIFIKLFEKGLAYKKEMPINWCPSCKIGLANEEVIDGKCERCGTEVSRRNISQWVVKITDYADRLVDGLKDTNFIEKVKMAQVNWIGKSEGAKIKFSIKDRDETLEVFTTRPDTLYGVTFMVISPEHKLAIELADNNVEVRKYLEETRKKSDMERTDLNKDKTGVFSGLYTINPVNDKEIPIWISDFVLASYGTGAIMSVPAHDQRDFDFAKKFNIEIMPVVKPMAVAYDPKTDFDGEIARNKIVDDARNGIKPFCLATGTLINSQGWSGLEVPREFEKILKDIENKQIGVGSNSYHLRDWIFSRQHYWGEPIPMINCPVCGWVPEKEENLPIVLPEVEAYEPTDDGLSPLSRIPEFVNCKCPKCGEDAKRETDTMPNWAGSDWYFLRYIDPFNKNNLVDFDLLKKWGPVDVYIGGDEHNTLHLLYSRFIYQFLYDLDIFPKELPEPYFMRMSHGVILGPDNQRMSKSKGNVIVPEVVADKFGVDVVRLYLMFMGPFDGTMAWNENTLMGVKRFLERFEKYINSQSNYSGASDTSLKLIIARLIEGVTKDIESFGYNTAIAKLMGGLNQLMATNLQLSVDDQEVLLKLIAPFAPYTSEELWSQLGQSTSVFQASWPVVDEKYLVDSVVKLPVAINGKTRAIIDIGNEYLNNEEYINGLIESNEIIKKYLLNKVVLKRIYIPGKMVNLVI